jgi:hypothetical protein
MLPGVTTGVTTGEHGAGFAGAANAESEIGAANARASIGAFMTRLHIWTVVIFGISASADRLAPAGPKMLTLVLPARDRDHKFRTIQNDSTFLRADCRRLGADTGCDCCIYSGGVTIAHNEVGKETKL